MWGYISINLLFRFSSVERYFFSLLFTDNEKSKQPVGKNGLHGSMLSLWGILSSSRLNEKITLMSSIFFPALTFHMKILLRGVVWEVRIEKISWYYLLPFEFSMKALPITWLKKLKGHLTIFQIDVIQLSLDKHAVFFFLPLEICSQKLGHKSDKIVVVK